MIRCARRSDAPRLEQIIRKAESTATGTGFRTISRSRRNEIADAASDPAVFRPGCHLYVYEDDGIIKGMIEWTQTDPVCEEGKSETCLYSDLCCYEKYASCSAEIKTLCVDPEFAGSGIGRRILESFLKSMQYQDIRCASIWILVDDPRALDFCEDFGFTQTTESRILPDGGREVKFVKQNC